MSQHPTNTFETEAEQLTLFPDTSGNDINGVDDNTVRRPASIYWLHPKTIAHSALQQWITERFVAEPSQSEHYLLIYSGHYRETKYKETLVTGEFLQARKTMLTLTVGTVHQRGN